MLEQQAKIIEKQGHIIENMSIANEKFGQQQREMLEQQKAMLQQQGEMLHTVQQLATTVASLVQQLTADGGGASTRADPIQQIPSPSAIKAMAYSAVVKAQLDAPTIVAKAKNLVLCNVGELDEKGMPVKDLDQKILNETFTNLGDKDLQGKWQRGEIKFHRHPETRPPTARGRPLKVFLQSQADRDLVLGHVRRQRPSSLRAFPHAYIRRDLTREELSTDRDLRQRAGILNASFGGLKYVVRDLEIFTLSNPRPLPKRPQGQSQNQKV